MTKSYLGNNKGFIYFAYTSILWYMVEGCQARNLNVETEAEAMEVCCFMA